MNKGNRGILNDVVKEKSLAFLGKEITKEEVRLYHYLDYVWKNDSCIRLDKVDAEEISILTLRGAQGHLKIHGSYVYPTREFYDFVQDILAEAYVGFYIKEDVDNQPSSRMFKVVYETSVGKGKKFTSVVMATDTTEVIYKLSKHLEDLGAELTVVKTIDVLNGDVLISEWLP